MKQFRLVKVFPRWLRHHHRPKRQTLFGHAGSYDLHPSTSQKPVGGFENTYNSSSTNCRGMVDNDNVLCLYLCLRLYILDPNILIRLKANTNELCFVNVDTENRNQLKSNICLIVFFFALIHHFEKKRRHIGFAKKNSSRKMRCAQSSRCLTGAYLTGAYLEI